MCSACDFCSMSQQKNATAVSMGSNWAWEKLISEQPEVLDAAWSALVPHAFI